MSDDGRIEIVTYSLAEAVRENPEPRAPFLPFRFPLAPFLFPARFIPSGGTPRPETRGSRCQPPDTRPSPSATHPPRLNPRELLLPDPQYVYQIPPSATHAGHRADSWNVEKWLRACAGQGDVPRQQGRHQAGGQGQRRALRRVPAAKRRPVSTAVEPVIDSSRYFVLRVVDDASGRHAFLGLGFRERDHASDFKLAVQESTRTRAREREALKRREEHERLIAEKAAANAAAGVEGPAKLHDYSLKGTVTVNILPGGRRGPSR